MMGTIKPKYITVPIELLQTIHDDRFNTIHSMLIYGIYDRARKEFFDLEEIGTDEIEYACEYLAIDAIYISERLSYGKILYDKYYDRPNASISIKILMDFLREKSETELMLFCAYCAIRSMVGTKPFLKTTNEYLLSRMFGYATIAEYENEITNEYIQDLRLKYSQRYHLDKIKESLQANWGLVYYARYSRGFYVSFKMNLVELINIAEDRKDKSKLKELQRKQTIQAVLDARKNKQNLPKKDVPF